ncbi:hypothetical protein LguiB_031130 [Lonicera macranthoides]
MDGVNVGYDQTARGDGVWTNVVVVVVVHCLIFLDWLKSRQLEYFGASLTDDSDGGWWRLVTPVLYSEEVVAQKIEETPVAVESSEVTAPAAVAGGAFNDTSAGESKNEDAPPGGGEESSESMEPATLSITEEEGERVYMVSVEVDIESAGMVPEPVVTMIDGSACRKRWNSRILERSNSSDTMLVTISPKSLSYSLMHDLVPGLHPLRFKDLSLSNFGSLENVLEMVLTARNTRTSSAIIWNTIDHLEHSSLSQLHQQYYQIPFFSIGPLHKIATTSSTSLLKEDTTCIKWLDKQLPRSVIYISLGSLATIDEKEVAEMALGLANSGQAFLWVIRPGSIQGSEWIELLPEGFEEETKERSLIVKWAPQKEVLAHGALGGFWSHCGWNSALESVSEGVPMICMPSFADQKVTARYLSDVWRVGLQYEGELERGEIMIAINRLMVDKEGEEIRQRAVHLKEKVELSVSKGGSSYKSSNDLVEYILSLQLGK